MIRLSIVFSTVAFAACVAVAQARNDEVATASIVDATTDEKYLTDWVASLPDHPNVPSPRDVLGYTVGTPGELTHVDDIHRYFYELAEASPNVAVFSLGKSHEERDMLIAAIADQQTIKRLDYYKDINRQLADPRATDRQTADRLIAEGKPTYWMTAGLHSTELGPPEMTMELAYRLAVDEREVFETIRNNVITLITPVLETDGRARQVEWYRRHIAAFDTYEDTPPKSPPFWGHYTFHDNNRDGLAFTQPLTKNYVRGFYDWRPALSLDLHESVPLLYVSTGTGPYNEAVDPITITEWQSIANYEVSRLTGKGLEGVWTWGFYTGWFPGYLLWVTNNHNANGRFYETFGNHTAKTVERDITRSRLANEKITDKTWYRALPPERKFLWSMRNNTNYMQTGTIASLEMVARNPTMFLENFYQKAVNGMRRAVTRAPYAFVVPADQTDRNAASDMLAILDMHAIEYSIAAEPFGNEDNTISKGDVIIKLNQPYGPLAQNLLENQKFPEKVEVPPYDDVAWTLGLHMGVTVNAVNDEAVLDLKTTDDGHPFDKAGERTRGRYALIAHRGQNELGPLRFALGDARVLALAEPFEYRDTTYPAGSLVIDTDSIDDELLDKALTNAGLDAVGMRRLDDGMRTFDADLPRVAVLHSWLRTQDAGWVRYTLDTSGVPYDFIDKETVRAGNLRGNYDVLIVPALWGGATAAHFVAGVDARWSPLAYTQTDATPSHGILASSEDITGGLGFTGMAEIEAFIHAGGTLVGLSSGGVIAADSGITRDVGVSRPSGMNTPGSFITTKILGKSPLTYGYDDYTYVFRGNGPLFTVSERDRELVAMQFGDKTVPEPFDDEKADEEAPTAPPLVRSGAILGGKQQLDGAPALVREKVGDGSVVLFSWNPLHRHLNHHDHGFFYNALLFWNDLNSADQGAESDAG